MVNNFLIDYNECTDEEDNVNCPEAATCVNTKGSYSCECPHGYEMTMDGSECTGMQTVVYIIFYLHVWEQKQCYLTNTFLIHCIFL